MSSSFESQQAYEDIFNLSIDLICIAGFDGMFKKVNPAFKTIFGWEMDELNNQPFFNIIHPDDIEATQQEVMKLTQGEQTLKFDIRILCKNGDYKLISWTGNPKLENNIFYVTGRDITDYTNILLQKSESETKLKEAQRLSKMGNWEFNTTQNTIYWSEQMYEIYEFDKNISQDELQKLYYGSFTPNELLKLKEQVQHSIKTGEPYAIERKLVLDNGKREKWIFGYSKVVHKNGDIILSGTVQDITDKKILELETIESQEKFIEAQRISKIGSWEVNLLTNETYWSPEQYRIFEVEDIYSPTELKDIWISRTHPDDKSALLATIEHGINTRETINIEMRIVLDDNRIKYIKSIGYVTFDQQGVVPLAYIGTTQDITERKLIEIENQKIQERLNDAQKISKIGSWEIDLLTGKISWSKQQYEIYELDESLKDEELRQAWRNVVHKKDLEDLEQLTYFAISTGQEYSIEIKAIFDEGTRVKYILALGYVIKDENGRNITYVGTAQDITERKLIELQNQKIQESLNEAQKVTKIGSWEFDLMARKMSWSEELYRIFEIDNSFKDDALIEENRTRLAEDDLLKLDTLLANTLADGEKRTIIYKAHFDDGQRFKYVKSKVFGITNEGGKVVKLAGTTQDITETKLIEDELIAAKTQAESASFAKSEFLANMSHEIRTPLNGVIGFSDLLMNTKLDTTQQLYINTINNSAKSLLDIVNDILDFSKIEAGKLDVEHQQTDIEKVLSEASNIVAYQCQSKKIELLLNISSDLPQLIWADPVRLRQILVNLLSNAVKFTLNGEIELKVDVLSKTINKSKLRFSVRDTGVGIHPDKIQNIFKAFSQEDTSITRKFGGTGLGLTISNKLLALMNGSAIQVESELGKGSVFYFDINFQSQNKKDNKYDYLSHVKKVLIVENNVKASQIIARILKIHRIDTELASDGIEALYLLKKQTDFDAIIVDYNLPDLNGMEVIKKIRSNANSVIAQKPIILLHTSAEDSNLQSLCVEYGVKQQILKPVTASSILNALTKMNEVDEVKINDIASTSSTIDTKGKIESVLITDDNSVNILLAKTIVKNILPNAIIFTAKNGLEAVEIYKNSKPSIILMDVQMPEMNGYEATKEIRLLESETNSHVPIIALTAGTVLGEKERCLEAGMDNYVSKPFVKETIEKTIKQYLFI